MTGHVAEIVFPNHPQEFPNHKEGMHGQVLLALLASPPHLRPPGDECTFPIYPHINKGRAWHKADTTQLAPKEVTYR